MVNNRSSPFLASCARVLKLSPFACYARLLRRLTEGKRLFEGWVSFEGIQWLNFRLIVCFDFPIKVLATTTATATKTPKKIYFFLLFPQTGKLFCTFLCRHLTTSRRKFLILRFVGWGGGGRGGTRQRLSFSFPQLRYSLLVFNTTRFANMSRIKRDALSVIIKWRFRSRHPRCCVSSNLTAIGKKRLR